MDRFVFEGLDPSIITEWRFWNEDWKVVAKSRELLDETVIAVQFQPAPRLREPVDLPCDVEPILEVA